MSGDRLSISKLPELARCVKIPCFVENPCGPIDLAKAFRRLSGTMKAYADSGFKRNVMSRITRLDRSEVTPDLAALFDKVFAQRGNVPNMFRVMAHRPEIFSTMQAHFAAVLNTGTVPTKLKELIIVRTSQVNNTPYCLASHTVLAKGLGWSDEQLANLGHWQQREDFTPAEKAALHLAETVTRDAHAVTDQQFAELRTFFTEGEIVELLCAIGLFNYFNRFNNALRMEPTKPGEGGCAPQSAQAGAAHDMR